MDNRHDNYEPNFILRDNPEKNHRQTNSPDSVKAAAENASPAGGKKESEFSAAWSSGRTHSSSRDFGDSFGVGFRNSCDHSDRFSFREQANRAESHGEHGRPDICQQQPGYDSPGRRAKEPSKPITLTRKRLALLIVVCMVLSCLCGMGSSALIHSISNSKEVPQETESVSEDGYDLHEATGANLSVSEITEATQGSIVEITTESVVSDSWLPNYVTQGAGSGVIITKDGYIMTNNHVIADSNKITVTARDGKTYDATLVGTDPTNDVAVIKVKASNLHPVTYGNSNNLKVGDLAVAIGNPLGELGGTVTAGIISATDRDLVIDGKTMHLLQTDTSINPGNSGGGLFNEDGQLVGLVVAKSSGSDVEGLGFAIPVNVAADVAQQLMEQGYVSGQPITGMTYTEGSSGFDSWFGSDSGTVYIYSVDSKVAKDAGFAPGDVVYAIDGKIISSIDDVSAIVTAHKVGDALTYTIVRNGKESEISLKLQEKKH